MTERDGGTAATAADAAGRAHAGGSSPSARPAEPLRGLAANGPSKVGVSGAMRARDVSRPVESRGRPAAGQPPAGAGRSGSSPVDS
jgi:hypothetical protein